MESPSSSTGTPKPAPSLALFAVSIAVAVAGLIYLLKTNPAVGAWAQAYDPTGHWMLSTLVAALPLIVLLGAMAVLRLKAHIAAVAGLLTALAIDRKSVV